MEGEFRLFRVLSREKGISIKTIQTRMHSSRMRTVRCSGRFIGGVCLGNVFPGGYLPRMGCLTRRGSLFRSRGVCQGGEGGCLRRSGREYLPGGVFCNFERERERAGGGGTVWGCYLPTVFLELSIPPFFSDTPFTLPAGNDPGSPSGK